MKPLIYATTRSHSKAHEEERLRKSIKGSLEAINITYSTSVFDQFDLVHFINPRARDINVIADARRYGVPTIASALYCEMEKQSSMVVTHRDKRILKNKVRKCLNASDLVLVPGEKSKKFLEEQGILTKIIVFPIPVKLERFKLTNETEKALFIRYFTERKDTNFIICLGDYHNKIEMGNLVEVAELCPFAKFYFFGANYSSLLGNKFVKAAPKNVVFSSLVDDDIYRSTLVQAKILLVLAPHKIEAINVLEAMAANTQVVAISANKNKDSYLENGKNAYLRGGITELVDCLDQLIKGKLKYTTSNAYRFVSNYNLVRSGNRLKSIYQALLKEKRGVNYD